MKGYTFDFRIKSQRGRIVYSNHVHSDPTYFPFLTRRRGEERGVSLSGANYMSGKEELDQEIPLPPEIEEWGKCAEMRYDDHQKISRRQNRRQFILKKVKWKTITHLLKVKL